jgi:hypothetical protein
MKDKTIKGQIALVVLVISVVVMTLGLSMSKIAKVDTKIDSDEEALKKAFNAAESAIDYYQGTGQTSYNPDDRTKALVEVNNLGGGQELILDAFSPAAKTEYFWLCGHDSDGNIDDSSFYSGSGLDVCVDAGFSGALKIDYFYKEGAAYQVKRMGINLGGAETVSGFSDQSVDADNCVDVSSLLSGTPLLLSVTPLSSGTNLRLKGNANFPSQGEEIRAVGTVDDAVNQKVRVSKRFYIPEFMLDGITAGGNVLSN